MIEFCNGNVLDADTDAIAQQVNCMGVMGAGLAKQIRNRYPSVYDDYKDICRFTNKFELLGYAQFCKVDNKYIVNLFGQCRYGRDKQYTELTALKDALRHLRDSSYYIYEVKSIAIPYGIGCGLGGADWDDVYEIIKLIFERSSILVKIYKL